MALRLSQDIEHVLNDWEYEPGRLKARVILGNDGVEKIQMRIDLGVIQMESSGRPDGTRPRGYESLLEYHEARANDTIACGGEFSLTSDDCAELMREGLQYYRRYRSAFELQRYELVARDTARNLRLFAFVGRYAALERDKVDFDQYRPYVQMMSTRALAALALEAGNHRAAIEKIDEGIRAIRQFLAEYKQAHREKECDELKYLLRFRREVEHERPSSVLEKLKRQLAHSVVIEDYAKAARLRDQIRRLQETDSA
jgi:hypothetical protein